MEMTPHERELELHHMRKSRDALVRRLASKQYELDETNSWIKYLTGRGERHHKADRRAAGLLAEVTKLRADIALLNTQLERGGGNAD